MSDAERHQRRQQRVGPGRHRHGVAHAEVRSKLLFERVDFGAEYEPLAVADAFDRAQ